jgi:hypothetical protein
MARPVTAVQHGNHIYSLEHIGYKRDRTDPMYAYKYTAYIDGQRWRYFRQRKEFFEAVDLQPLDFHLGAHAREVQVAEFLSTHHGAELLDKIIRRAQELKNNGQHLQTNPD